MLTKMIAPGGVTMIAGGFDQPDREQFDQMGELLHFLRNWLIQHINDSDRRFGAHFHKVGLAAHAQWSKDTERTMKKKKWWWKFW